MSNENYRNGRHVVYKLHAHIILVTKYRRNIMTERVSEDLKAAFYEVASRRQFTINAVETDGDHAHLLITYPPKLALSSLVMTLKTVSSQQIRSHGWTEVKQALWGEHFWSPSYCVVSCGGAPLEVVKAYVENQQSPNRTKGRPRQPNHG
jgi:putative transposase